jgi:transcriptional regulator with GAF, ATPase, and Fis domain
LFTRDRPSANRSITFIAESQVTNPPYYSSPMSAHQASRLTQGRVLSPCTTELKLPMQEAMSAPSQTLSDAERAHILGILKETNWTIGGRDGAAARLGVRRTTLISRMQKLGISSRPAALPRDRTINGPQLLASHAYQS